MKTIKPKNDSGEVYTVINQDAFEAYRAISNAIRTIDEKTDDLLDLADDLEAYQVNHQMDNGAFINPVSKIRIKTDIIWDEASLIRCMAREMLEQIEKMASAAENNEQPNNDGASQ